MSQNTTIPVKVGVVLEMDTWLGKMGLAASPWPSHILNKQ